MNLDVESLTDSELRDVQRDATLEQKRRAALEAIPMQIEEMAEQYRAGGGQQATLEAAIAPA